MPSNLKQIIVRNNQSKQLESCRFCEMEYSIISSFDDFIFDELSNDLDARIQCDFCSLILDPFSLINFQAESKAIDCDFCEFFEDISNYYINYLPAETTKISRYYCKQLINIDSTLNYVISEPVSSIQYCKADTLDFFNFNSN